jgi:hypothetical protein
MIRFLDETVGNLVSEVALSVGDGDEGSLKMKTKVSLPDRAVPQCRMA